MSDSDLELIAAAKAVRGKAYAPYSGYKVGAAVRDEEGKIYAGCNVENVSYGLCLCAERSAISRMIAEGGTKIQAAAVVTQDGGTPCGMCLQTIAEFAGDPTKVRIIFHAADGSNSTFVLSELLPHGFSSDAVKRTSSKEDGSY